MSHHNTNCAPKKVVIFGAGFAGFNTAKELSKMNFKVYLIDKHNYHLYQSLFYQVATAVIEPASISFPLRKAFQGFKNFQFRMGTV